MLTALRPLSRGNLWCALGGGGKTSLLFALASQAASGVVTTTTHMRPAPADWLSCSGPPWPGSGWAFSCAEVREGKAVGHPAELVQSWAEAAPDKLFLVEADGSRGLPLKLHAEHEPVLPSAPGLVLLVTGMSAWGRTPASSLHRPELLRASESYVGLATYVEVIGRALQRCANFPTALIFSQASDSWRRAWALEIAERFPQLPALWRHHGRWGWVSRGES